jgi:large subunit ribosomal protein L23
MTRVFTTEERLLSILLMPRITEKSAFIATNRQYVFKVISTASKPEIKKAVEFYFQVKVDAVQVMCVKSKAKRLGRIEGRRKAWKKAYVKLAEGYKIEYSGA